MVKPILHHLQDSRSFRIVWLLEELKVDYELVYHERVNGRGPSLKKVENNAIGKAPFLIDGDIQILESSAIAEYIVEKWGRYSGLLPSTSHPAERAAVRSWSSFSEGTLILHSIPMVYAKWFISNEDISKDFQEKLQGNIINDFEHVESSLAKKNSSGDLYLVGDSLTIADIMLEFSVHFTIGRGLLSLQGSKAEALSGGKYPNIDRWHNTLRARPAYQVALNKPPGSTKVNNF